MRDSMLRVGLLAAAELATCASRHPRACTRRALWALGHLRYSDHAFLGALESPRCVLSGGLEDFDPISLSSVLTALGRLDHCPDGDLLSRLAQRCRATLPDFAAWALVSVATSFAELAHWWAPEAEQPPPCPPPP